MRLFTLIWAVGRFLLLASHVFALSVPGHMIVAAIAYRDLGPQERQQAAGLLKLHYNYSKWKAEVPDNDAKLDEGIALFTDPACPDCLGGRCLGECNKRENDHPVEAARLHGH